MECAQQTKTPHGSAHDSKFNAECISPPTPHAHTRLRSERHDTMQYVLLITDTCDHSSFCAEPHFEAVMHAFSSTR
jgi:hypothetical protein